jgi:tRNA-guanine family transglycosylase
MATQYSHRLRRISNRVIGEEIESKCWKVMYDVEFSNVQVKEQGVVFQSPYTDEVALLTPEDSIAIQTKLGSDIIMQVCICLSATEQYNHLQLDHVVHAKEPDEVLVEKAMYRYVSVNKTLSLFFAL